MSFGAPRKADAGSIPAASTSGFKPKMDRDNRFIPRITERRSPAIRLGGAAPRASSRSGAKFAALRLERGHARLPSVAMFWLSRNRLPGS